MEIACYRKWARICGRYVPGWAAEKLDITLLPIAARNLRSAFTAVTISLGHHPNAFYAPEDRLGVGSGLLRSSRRAAFHQDGYLSENHAFLHPRAPGDGVDQRRL